MDHILFELFVIFAVAKLVGEVFERLRQPPVIGELLVGIALGPHAVGIIGDTEVHHVLQELGAVVLLFMVGLDTRLPEVRAVGTRALVVGSAGIVLPFLLGAGYIGATGRSGEESAFIGAAMVATSVGITARVLADLGRPGRHGGPSRHHRRLPGRHGLRRGAAPLGPRGPGGTGVSAPGALLLRHHRSPGGPGLHWLNRTPSVSSPP